MSTKILSVNSSKMTATRESLSSKSLSIHGLKSKKSRLKLNVVKISPVIQKRPKRTLAPQMTTMMKKVKMKKIRIQIQLQRALMKIVRQKTETHPILMLILSMYRKGIQRKRLTRMIDNCSNKKLKFPTIRDNNSNSMILKYSKSNSHSHQSHP